MKHFAAGLFAFILFALLSCAGSRPTLQDAQVGLRLACDSLALAMSHGTKIPARELALQACDVERTSAIMRQLILRAERAQELLVPEPDWLEVPSPGDRVSDAGADAGASP